MGEMRKGLFPAKTPKRKEIKVHKSTQKPGRFRIHKDAGAANAAYQSTLHAGSLGFLSQSASQFSAASAKSVKSTLQSPFVSPAMR